MIGSGIGMGTGMGAAGATGTGAGAGAAAGAGTGAAGACMAGATTLWPGSGRTPAVGRIEIAKETTSAATPTMKIEAKTLPSSANGFFS
jgi:hypothetical protein